MFEVVALHYLVLYKLQKTKEHLNCMAVPQWKTLVPEGDPFPIFNHRPSKCVQKRLAGNGMHGAVIGTVHSIVLATLVMHNKQ